MFLFALLLAAVAGMAMAIQGSMNTGLGKIVGLLESTFIVHIIGAVLLVILLYIFRLGQGDLGRYNEAPWYLYLGGILSVVILYAVVASISRVGVAAATTAIIVGQISTAVLIDYLGLFGLERIPFTWTKAVGIVLLAAGTKFMLMR